MGLGDLVPPVASPHRDDIPADGSVYSLLGALNTQTDISFVILDGKCLEPGTLVSIGLLLYGHNL